MFQPNHLGICMPIVAPSSTVVSVTSHLLSLAPQTHITAPAAATTQSATTVVAEAASGSSAKYWWTMGADLKFAYRPAGACDSSDSGRRFEGRERQDTNRHESGQRLSLD